MIFKNAMSFKMKIKQIALEKGISTQQVQQNYLIEAFLEKLAQSEFKDNFILKGGFLIGKIVGLDQRSTMDLDTTVKGFTLTQDKLTMITEQILAVATNESFSFQLVSIGKIREVDEYPGLRIKLRANFEKIHETVSIDVTTGDKITPKEISFGFKSMFSNDEIKVLSYPVETILAEKIETILSRGIGSTRPRDFYDVYILSKLRENEIDYGVLSVAFKNTRLKRNSVFKLKDYRKIMTNIEDSEFQQNLWKKYQQQYSYAREISFTEIVNSVLSVINRFIEE